LGAGAATGAAPCSHPVAAGGAVAASQTPSAGGAEIHMRNCKSHRCMKLNKTDNKNKRNKQM